ncbi:MAG: hypothetical protein M9929_05850 [Burkholderiaceae bacterium]|nr:hypothetical protein [Burkholderiaceae bacterium]
MADLAEQRRGRLAAEAKAKAAEAKAKEERAKAKEEKRGRLAAEAKAKEGERQKNIIEASKAYDGIASLLGHFAEASMVGLHTDAVRAKGFATGGGAHVEQPHERDCRVALRRLCRDASAKVAIEGIRTTSKAWRKLAKAALKLARIEKRVEVDTIATKAVPTVQRLMTNLLTTLAGAVESDALWVPEVEVSSVLRLDKRPTPLSARADGALLPKPERHANVVTVSLTAEYKSKLKSLMKAGLAQARQQAAIRLVHLLDLRYYEVVPHPTPTEPLPGRLAAHGFASDGFHLFVVCVEVVYTGEGEGTRPHLVFSKCGPLRLWSKSLMRVAATKGRARKLNWKDCVDVGAPGLVALASLLKASRGVLGDMAYVRPPGLQFWKAVPSKEKREEKQPVKLPLIEEWTHLGSGGASEAYCTTIVVDGEAAHGGAGAEAGADAGGPFVVVKVARHPGASWQTLDEEVCAYQQLCTPTSCPAIPVLEGCATVAAEGDERVAAIILSPGDGSKTVPVREVMNDSDRIVKALLATWSALVALHFAHAKGVVHRDVRGANTVWKEGSKLPTHAMVKAAISAAKAAGFAAAVALLPPPAQLVDWGIASTRHVGAKSVKNDIRQLGTRLLPSLLDAGKWAKVDNTATRSSSIAPARLVRVPASADTVAELLAGGRPKLEKRAKAAAKELFKATSAETALLPVLKLLKYVLT